MDVDACSSSRWSCNTDLESCGWDQEWWIQTIKSYLTQCFRVVFLQGMSFSLRLFVGLEFQIRNKFDYSVVIMESISQVRIGRVCGFRLRWPRLRLTILTLVNDWTISFIVYVCRICIWGGDTVTLCHACEGCGIGAVTPSYGFWGSNSAASLLASHLTSLAVFFLYIYFPCECLW